MFLVLLGPSMTKANRHPPAASPGHGHRVGRRRRSEEEALVNFTQANVGYGPPLLARSCVNANLEKMLYVGALHFGLGALVLVPWDSAP